MKGLIKDFIGGGVKGLSKIFPGGENKFLILIILVMLQVII
jgi:hypothetical protein